MGLWSFLRGLWPWRARPQPSQPSHPGPPPETAPETAPAAAPERELPLAEEAVAVAATVEPAEPAATEPPVSEEDEEQDEDGGWEDEDFEDPDDPDPFISGAAPEADDADLKERRAAARATALSGEQRIYLSMPAGPGSLAEALEQLATEGLVTAEFVGDGEDAPHILYRPV
ncbi:MAG TPA: hypothetical protein VJS38_04215 [Phenylobacterium sp.]|uniref:hypothetical protein n=1 Tax=Phenylobacterium sp. TaxID=1871053 RepID=UPI002B485CB2|nr:hypothetical protein [Phenylobacterium sp.]HKR87356.1 hypothetical protein [Phenylobacterium sp.]